MFQRSVLSMVAYPRIISLTLIFTFPTVLSGCTDWQHIDEGDGVSPIKVKLALSGVRREARPVAEELHLLWGGSA